MNTQTLQVFSLRGMDERWIVDAQDALYIQDMTLTQNDSWRTSGGFFQVYQPDPVEIVEQQEPVREGPQYGTNEPNDNTPDTSTNVASSSTSSSGTTSDLDGFNKYGKINSLHWFAQHNGARQWLIFEEQNFIEDPDTGDIVSAGTTSLKVFDGSLSKTGANDPRFDKPIKTLYEYAEPDSDQKIFEVNSRHEPILASRTQSQSYGGRIYLVNGFDQPIVFDGDICERAGFAERPPSPTAQAGSAESSTTFPICIGDSGYRLKLVDSPVKIGDVVVDGEKNVLISKPRSRGHYSLHFNSPYFGLGSTSDAEIGAGAYRFRGASTSIPFHANEFQNAAEMRYNFYGGQQDNSRKCGFQYRVTYVNDRGQESEPSSASSIVTVENGSGGRKKAHHGKCIISVDIPIGPKECVARRVYRTRNVYDSQGNLYTKGDQKSFYLLTEISDNMTTRFVDGTPDTSLGELLDLRDLGNFPHRTKFLAMFKNTMFAAGGELNEIQFSAPLFPEVFPRDNILTVGDDDGGPITGMRATKNALVVFKARGIYLIKGDPVNGFSAQTLNKDIGCIAPNSIAELPGLGLVFLSERTVYLLEGALENTGSVTGVVAIGAEIPNQLELLNRAAAIRASGAVYEKDREYWLSIPTLGSQENDLCLIYHYEAGSWSIREDFPIDCMVVSKDHRGYLFIGSNDTRNDLRTGILVYTRGTDTKGSRTISLNEDGTVDKTEKIPITSIYETVSNDYQSVFTNFRPAHVMAYAVGYGDNGMNVNTRVNRSIDKVRTTVQTSDQQDPNEAYPVYGKAKFEDDRWISYRPTVIRFDVSTTHKGPVRELSISFASAVGNKIELIGYDLEAKVGEQRNIKPLNKALRTQRR